MKKNRVYEPILIKRTLSQALLGPFTVLYGAVMDLRNVLYRRELLKSYPSPQFSLVVGNLTVGGTGKTPMVEYLIRELSKKYRIVTLSRGYGRRSRGFVLAAPETTAEQIGDEPLQYYEKFSEKVKVAVCEDRVVGATTLFDLFPEHGLLVLDDAFQHRSLRADRYLLLNDYNRPFYRDFPFPGGRLRENRQGASRADAIITTKCPPNLGESQREEIKRKILRYARQGTPCFFSSIRYGTLRTFDNTEVDARSVILVAAIAQPDSFIDYVRSQFNLRDVHMFPDHYAYTARDVEELLKNAKNTDLIVTTEKDRVKLRPLAQQAGVLARFGFIPIEIDFGTDADPFRSWLKQQVEEPVRDRTVRL